MKKQNVVVSAVLGLERTVRWSIFLITMFVMFYLVVNSLMKFFAYPIDVDLVSEANLKITDSYLPIWKGCRNLLYLLLLLHLPLVGLSVMTREKLGQIKTMLQPVFVWFGLLNLVTFSYVLAFLIRDLIIVAYVFSKNISQ